MKRPSFTRMIFAVTLIVAAVSCPAGTILYRPAISSVALLSRASFNEVAKLGSVDSGILRRCWIILRSSFEITIRFGIFKRSESESAKLSPTQLNSGLLDVFSNGRTITTSEAGEGDCADAL